MKAAVIGGRLQGVEAVYLAQKAGWETFVIDCDDFVPAKDLADRFYRMDVTTDNQAEAILKECDLIVPALENKTVLKSLGTLADKIGVPFVFDSHAYGISCSKSASNQLFIETEIPIPRLWPEGRFPLIVKPSGASGSAGVRRVVNEEDLKALGITDNTTDWVIQEYVHGPSYSIEVIGFQGKFQVFQVTELEMDGAYDCKRVLTPAGLDPALVKDFTDIGQKAAAAIDLQGIMDVEVILHDGLLKVLEIDARLPSQTPTAVFHSTGINLLEILGINFGYNKSVPVTISREKGVIYEHLRVTPEKAEILGEHIMSDAGPLRLCTDFFGADEALTNYRPGSHSWVATLINTGQTRAEAWEKRNSCLQAIMKDIRKPGLEDISPAD